MLHPARFYSNTVQYHEIHTYDFFGCICGQMIGIDIMSGSEDATGNFGLIGGIFQRVFFEFVEPYRENAQLGEGEVDARSLGRRRDLVFHPHLSLRLLFSSMPSWSSHA